MLSRTFVRTFISTLAVGSALPAFGQNGEITLYSGRKEALLKPLLEEFTQKSGIKVNVKYGKDSQLVTQLTEEKQAAADAILVSDATLLDDLARKGKLQTFSAAAISKVPADAKAKDSSWVGLSRRARVLLVNTKMLKPEQYPKSMFELTDKKWAGKVASTGLTQSAFVAQIAGMKVLKGEKIVTEWLSGLKSNKTAWFEDHTQVRKAVGKGEFPVGVINHYYGHLEKAEGSPVEIVYADQGEKDMGALYNYSSIGLIKDAKNAANVNKLTEFLLTEGQKKFAELNFEFPIDATVPVKVGVKDPKTIKFSPVTIEQMGAERELTLALGHKLGL
jgi:iron(III) transport system substrate-binding protein